MGIITGEIKNLYNIYTEIHDVSKYYMDACEVQVELLENGAVVQILQQKMITVMWSRSDLFSVLPIRYWFRYCVADTCVSKDYIAED